MRKDTTTINDLFFIIDLLEKENIIYYLDGGWAVDVIYGKETRIHRDIDIDFDSLHTDKLLSSLFSQGYVIDTNQFPVRIELYSDEHGYLDIHPFVLNNDGSAKQSDFNNGWFNFEKDFFSETIFENKRISLISLKGQLIFHTGYELRDKDKHDIAILEKILNEKKKKFNNVYFFNGTAYAGKSTMVKYLSKKYNGIACEENYHDIKLPNLDKNLFPSLTYTRDLKNWSDFIRRNPDEYEKWVNGCIKECTILELEIIEELLKQNKKIFVDTNIPVEVLKEITDKNHVIIMLTDNETSVDRFFDRPDKEKQFLYQLLLKEENPEYAINNFKECLKRINSLKNYNNFLQSGFNVILKDESRSIAETATIIEKILNLNK